MAIKKKLLLLDIKLGMYNSIDITLIIHSSVFTSSCLLKKKKGVNWGVFI
jgi:hypothetical protein